MHSGDGKKRVIREIVFVGSGFQVFLLWVSLILMIYYGIVVFLSYLNWKELNTPGPIPKEKMEPIFKRAQKHVFVGKEGKRPFLVFRQYPNGSLEVHCRDRNLWIKI